MRHQFDFGIRSRRHLSALTLPLPVRTTNTPAIAGGHRRRWTSSAPPANYGFVDQPAPISQLAAWARSLHHTHALAQTTGGRSAQGGGGNSRR
jgi:hypothetical protein